VRAISRVVWFAVGARHGNDWHAVVVTGGEKLVDSSPQRLCSCCKIYVSACASLASALTSTTPPCRFFQWH
jgi:hypothetical protein